MLAKATGLAADVILLDLEDSVAPDAKPAARARVAELLNTTRFAAPTVAVRVNAVDGPWAHRDLVDVIGAAGARVDVVVLPKVESAGEVAFADHLLAGLEREIGRPAGAIGLEVQIETATGLRDADAIASACPRRLEALILGPGDLAADLGLGTVSIGGPLQGYPGDGWHAILVRMLVAARAAGLQAIDGPYARIDDPEGLVASARRARALGYDGKWSIHPSQIPVLDAAFGVSRDEYEHAASLLAAYERAHGAGLGAIRVGDEMVDEATRQMAARVVERGRLAGLRPPAPPGL